MDPTGYRRAKIDPISFRRAKINPTYLSHRGSGQDVVQENWILEKSDFFFFLK